MSEFKVSDRVRAKGIWGERTGEGVVDRVDTWGNVIVRWDSGRDETIHVRSIAGSCTLDLVEPAPAPQPKFKAGDKVRIVDWAKARPFDSSRLGVAEEGVLQKWIIDTRGSDATVYTGWWRSEAGWYLHEDGLELVSRETVFPVAVAVEYFESKDREPEFQVGETAYFTGSRKVQILGHGQIGSDKGKVFVKSEIGCGYVDQKHLTRDCTFDSVAKGDLDEAEKVRDEWKAQTESALRERDAERGLAQTYLMERDAARRTVDNMATALGLGDSQTLVSDCEALRAKWDARKATHKATLGDSQCLALHCGDLVNQLRLSDELMVKFRKERDELRQEKANLEKALHNWMDAFTRPVPEEEEAEPYYDPPRTTVAHKLTLLGLGLVPMAAAGVLYARLTGWLP
jgi:hypothetical protein